MLPAPRKRESNYPDHYFDVPNSPLRIRIRIFLLQKWCKVRFRFVQLLPPKDLQVNPYYRFATCPRCGEYVYIFQKNFCMACGQRFRKHAG